MTLNLRYDWLHKLHKSISIRRSCGFYVNKIKIKNLLNVFRDTPSTQSPSLVCLLQVKTAAVIAGVATAGVAIAALGAVLFSSLLKDDDKKRRHHK